MNHYEAPDIEVVPLSLDGLNPLKGNNDVVDGETGLASNIF